MKLVRAVAVIASVASPMPVLSSMPASADPAATPAAKISKPELRAKLKDCTKQADAKKLHGDERKTFRLACIKKAGVTSSE